ncbi:MAG TPA: HD-GYP domain-containing protein [Spirochaetota bacterium]|nr:HD-GYP domain-containing protein [Spirochaetota bacterium]
MSSLIHSFIISFVKALEAKDIYTAGHSDRVADISEKLSKFMGLDKNICRETHIAAHLHDIGKIGIPDGILLKTSKLSSGEFEVIKEHSVKGYEIIRDIEDFQSIAKIVRHHHERFDGQGYPDKLIGNDIPLASAIIAVADSFDAMTTTRSYKKSVSYKDAFEELEKNSGTQFNPEVVRHFLALYRK